MTRQQTTYAGIDYSLGRSNVDRETGIRYGVISVNSVNLDCWSEAEPDYGKATCPKCGTDVAMSDEAPDEVQEQEWFDGKDHYCVSCKACYWSDACFPDEAMGYSYSQDGYELTDCLDNDIFVLKSEFYTFAQFCSPCVPGACNLDSPMSADSGQPKCYCLGHDWFDGGIAPYRVFKVTDNTEMFSDRVKCDQCAMVAINGTACHEHGCPNSGKTWDAELGEWIRYVECRECGSRVRVGETCDCTEEN